MRTIKLNVRVDDRNKVEYRKDFIILDDYTVNSMAETWLHNPDDVEYEGEEVVAINKADIPAHENRNAEMTKYRYYNIVTCDDEGEKTDHYIAVSNYYDHAVDNHGSSVDVFLYSPFEDEPEVFSFTKSDYDGLEAEEAVDACFEEIDQNTADIPAEMADDIINSLNIFFGA